MSMGTRVVKNTVENEAGGQVDKLVDKGPVNELEDKVDERKDGVIRKTVNEPLT